MVEAAERLARNPDDPDAIRAYEQAQSRLTQLISEIMDASGQMTMEMEEIMREMREEASGTTSCGVWRWYAWLVRDVRFSLAPPLKEKKKRQPKSLFRLQLSVLMSRYAYPHRE